VVRSNPLINQGPQYEISLLDTTSTDEEFEILTQLR
jgi:hypothetical protein